MAKAMRKRPPPMNLSYSQEERTVAWRAITKFNEMRPQLTAFARSITGNKKVEIHATSQGAYTERNNIFLRPPLALGRDHRHTRNICGSRGDDGRQMCSACRTREVVDFYLFHEIGHIWLGTQAAVKKRDTDLALEHVTEWHPSGACHHAHIIMTNVSRSPEIMGVANSINQYLGAFTNALEDARVNEGMFDARPGLRHIFDVNIERLMHDGVEYDLGEMKLWKDAPADAQFSVALSIQAYGYEVDQWFHPDIVRAVQDERLRLVCRRAPNAADVHEIFELAVQAFLVAQELGFCLVPKCVIHQPPENNPADNSEEKDEADLDGDPSGGASGTDEHGGLPEPGGSDGPGDEGSEGETSESPNDDLGESESENSDRSESGGSSSGSNQEDDDPADATDSTGSEGGDSEQGSDGPSPPSEVDDGVSDDGGGESGNAGGLAVSDSSKHGNSDSGDSSTNDATPELSGSHGDEDGSDLDADRDSEVGGDGPDGLGDDEEESLADPYDDQSAPWAVAAPDHLEPPPLITASGEPQPMPEPGTPEDVTHAVSPFLMHGMNDLEGMIEDMLGESLASQLSDVETGSYDFDRLTGLIAIALSQVLYFDDPSMKVAGVDVATFPSPDIGWRRTDMWQKFMPPEIYLGKAVVHARRVFDDNKRTHLQPNLRSGKINASVLGKRAPLGDERLFGKKMIPKKKSHLVIITGDCSASTNSYNRNEKIKRLMMAQGEILHRVGVPFVMMGHSASDVPINQFKTDHHDNYWMYILPIKGEHERWGDACRERLAAMNPVSENLDGHTLEYVRKLADQSQATDVTIIYYTDGEMPASNATEEEVILRREIKICKQKGYHMLAVGINTSSPERFGMKTVRVDSDEDIQLVVKQLEEELTHL